MNAPAHGSGGGHNHDSAWEQFWKFVGKVVVVILALIGLIALLSGGIHFGGGGQSYGGSRNQAPPLPPGFYWK